MRFAFSVCAASSHVISEWKVNYFVKTKHPMSGDNPSYENLLVNLKTFIFVVTRIRLSLNFRYVHTREPRSQLFDEFFCGQNACTRAKLNCFYTEQLPYVLRRTPNRVKSPSYLAQPLSNQSSAQYRNLISKLYGTRTRRRWKFNPFDAAQARALRNVQVEEREREKPNEKPPCISMSLVADCIL